MRIRKFNEGNQNIIDYIKECFIDLVESSISGDMTIDDYFFHNEQVTELGVSVCLQH